MANLPPCRLKDKERVHTKCSVCGCDLELSYAQFHRRGESKYPWKCKRCVMVTMSKEDKEKRSAKIKKALGDKTPEEKAAMTKSRLATISTPEFREERKKTVQATWRNKSEEELKRISERSSKNTQHIWDTMPQEERNRRKKARMSGFREWHDNLTPEELAARSKMRSEINNGFWKKQDAEYALAHGEFTSEHYKNMTDEEIRQSHLKDNLDNMFHIAFENFFNASHISKQLHFIQECPQRQNDVVHSWDYGIFDIEDRLIAVVDVDGEAFHGDDMYDYKPGHTEYSDEQRWLSVNPGVKIFIINGYKPKFEDSLKYMEKHILMDYDEYVQKVFHYLSEQPFPYPSYRPIELLRSYRVVSKERYDSSYKRTLLKRHLYGYHIMLHFHKSIWDSSVDGFISPHQAWDNKEILLESIRNHTIYQSYINKNKILQGFNVSSVAPRVSVFPAGLANLIIQRHLSEFDTIFDPFSGFSGRLLGAVSLGKKYIGTDPSIIRVNESNQMIQFLRNNLITIDAEVYPITTTLGNTFPCLFTQVPNGSSEHWPGCNQLPALTCDQWIDQCLKNFNCKRYVFVVAGTEKYQDKIVDVIINKSYLGASRSYIVIIDK